MTTDNVNHPQHYENHKIVLEPIDIIEGLPFSIANSMMLPTGSE